MKADFVLTSESVTAGHPDKLCDQISDAIVDRFLEADPQARIRAECAVATGVVFIAARFGTQAKLDVTEVAREVIREVGYDEGDFDAKRCTIMTSLSAQPPGSYRTLDARRLSNADLDTVTVENQTTVFGFACRQSPGLMPLPIWLAHRLAQRLAGARTERALSHLSPDAKAQVGVEYRDRRPVRIHSITLIASQSAGTAPSPEDVRAQLIERVITPVFTEERVRPDRHTRIFVNPEGTPMGGGPSVHAGLTGRKNAVDTYGEYARHSGDALSGKDPLRIDRVGAYAARHAAKNVVAAKLADECEVHLSYAIGLAGPVSIQVETFGTGAIGDDAIAHRLGEHIDCRLGGIVRRFDLQHLPAEHQGVFYRRLAAYGHVGRVDLELPWESTAEAEGLRG
jgi:S-adenosylmethionine synthetase